MSVDRALTMEVLIQEIGTKRYTKCSLCNADNLWEIDGLDKKEPAKVCSWCDVEKSRRWSGHHES